MSVTISMWLGVAFLALAVIAVVLQAWLWNPKYWDPVAKKSHAPRFWMIVHRLVGYAYAAIYVVMMVAMVPRLWEYQVELPARTVIHAVAAITIGVILFTKIAILRFFRHFEEAMPALGLALLVCTIVLGTLSLPFAFRAHGSAEVLASENRERVHQILTRLELEDGFTAEGLSTVSALQEGREVVVRKCTLCHDLRTILAEPRTGEGWLSLCRRMQHKPTLGVPLTDEDVYASAAYLIAITPSLQEDLQQRRDEQDDREERAEDLARALVDGPAPPTSVAVPSVEPASAGVVPATSEPVVIAADAGVPAVAAEEPRAPRRSARRRRRARRTTASSIAATTPTPTVASAPREAAPVPERLAYSPALAQTILRRACTDCHGLSDLDEHGGDDRAGWGSVVRRMIGEGAELTPDEARILVTYLAARYPLE